MGINKEDLKLQVMAYVLSGYDIIRKHIKQIMAFAGSAGAFGLGLWLVKIGDIWLGQSFQPYEVTRSFYVALAGISLVVFGLFGMFFSSHWNVKVGKKK